MRRRVPLFFSVLLLSFLLAACEGADSLPFGDGGTGGGGSPDVATTADSGGAPVCTPACDGRVCGPDGCGGSCAPGCGATQVCNAQGMCEFPSCVPNCAGRACGDDGCGNACGNCGAGQACNAAGQCVGTCQADCTGKQCGDDGCGGNCGTCGAGLNCDAGQCVQSCQPTCAGKSCGGDGCGGQCGYCGANEVCTAAGLCESTLCEPDCSGLQCGLDPECGQSCGTCGDGYACADGACACQADCSGKVCGDDGCGGSCGGCGAGQACNARGQCIDETCTPDCADVLCGPDPTCGQDCGGCDAGLSCIENQCVCVPSCVGVQCGSDGCGGSCGSCAAGLSCIEGVCACVPDCDGRECGSDGCGGTCGGCAANETCNVSGQCTGGTVCTPDCAGKQCGGDGCGGSCGSCAAGQTCNATSQCVATGDGPIVDAACSADADCGVGGTCMDFDFFPNGYCSVDCAADAALCPEGSGCWNLGDAGSFCLHSCTASTECREGYYCDADNTCWPGDEPQPGTGLVGTPCNSDADCDGSTCYPEIIDGEPTGFAGGYCVIFDCSETVACPTGSECYQITGGTVCLDTCSAAADCREGYGCDSNACLPSCTAGSCPDGYTCNETSGLCEEEPCLSDADCANGLTCTDGRCVVDIGNGPGAGPGPTCADLPPMTCEGTAAYCAELVPFEPDQGPGYDDYALNGETMANEYRSYIRRDVMIAVKYASAKTLCKLGEWDFGLGGPIGLGDMSESNGAIPGTSVGSPGHPEGTHTNGFDMDLGYFQLAPSPDNKLRPICDHYENGQEAYHCTAEPHLLDPWRTALFLAILAENPNLRVVGCDGQAGPIIMSALTQLCQAGWTTGVANCASPSWYDFPVTYETVNENRGWFYFHHHHFHISFSAPSNKASWAHGEPWCMTAHCGEESVMPLPRYDLQLPRRLPRVSRDAVQAL